MRDFHILWTFADFVVLPNATTSSSFLSCGGAEIRQFGGARADKSGLRDMAWTDERVTLLRELWSKGLSASQIAVQLGGVSRNAVIGKAHRLGLESRPSPIRGNGSGRSSRRNRAISRAIEARALRGTMADEEINGEPILPAERNEPAPPPAVHKASDVKQCLWPLGDPGDEDFRFCGEDTVPGRPYCTKHCAMAYIRKDKNAA